MFAPDTGEQMGPSFHVKWPCEVASSHSSTSELPLKIWLCLFQGLSALDPFQLFWFVYFTSLDTVWPPAEVSRYYMRTLEWILHRTEASFKWISDYSTVCKSYSHYKRSFSNRMWWNISVILAFLEAEAGGWQVPSQPQLKTVKYSLKKKSSRFQNW